MRAGGCQCGDIRYECADEPIDLFICHCRECRKQSASAFGISFDVARADFRLTAGEPRFWT
ncbi:MAG TPA: GFA family protein, partial [Gammaproteobacteria bacterium]